MRSCHHFCEQAGPSPVLSSPLLSQPHGAGSPPPSSGHCQPRPRAAEVLGCPTSHLQPGRAIPLHWRTTSIQLPSAADTSTEDLLTLYSQGNAPVSVHGRPQGQIFTCRQDGSAQRLISLEPGCALGSWNEGFWVSQGGNGSHYILRNKLAYAVLVTAMLCLTQL